MSKYPHLLSPLNLGDLELPNRVVMAPLTRGRATADYTANALMAEYYAQRASAGLIITEATHISLLGRGWYEAPDIHTPAHVAGWKLVTDAVHAAGGRIFCQLWHLGRASHSSFRTGLPEFEGDLALSVAPSALKRKSHGTTQKYTPGGVDVPIETPRALTAAEIDATVEEYRNAARCAREAGFDGVEVHAANGYLLDEFLQSASNVRTDEYGGSKEKRFRMIERVLDEAVLKEWPASRVGLRLSPNGAFNGMGSPDNHEAFLYYATRLEAYNLGYLHVMVGEGFAPFHTEDRPVTAKEIRGVYKNTLIVNTGYTAETGERDIADGTADLVAYGRPFISNPDLVARFANGWPLAAPKGMETFYSEVNNHPNEVGYTDYRPYEQERK